MHIGTAARIARSLFVTYSFQELRRSPRLPGRVEWIGIRQSRRGTIESAESAEAIIGGLVGDHYAKPVSASANRQVTLIQQEHFPVIARMLNKDQIDPALLRRNIVVSGINLQSLKKARFRIGQVELEGTGDCHPCSRMEENLGPGGYAAMAGHGGITAKVISPGHILLGDEVAFLDMVRQDESTS